MSNVDKMLFKHPGYMSDPYDRAHNMEIELMKRNKSKQAEQAFKPNSFIPKVFNSNRLIYQNDDSLKAVNNLFY